MFRDISYSLTCWYGVVEQLRPLVKTGTTKRRHNVTNKEGKSALKFNLKASPHGAAAGAQVESDPKAPPSGQRWD